MDLLGRLEVIQGPTPPQPPLVSMPAILQKGKHLVCQRCGNEDQDFFAQGPCLICGDKPCFYCLHCLPLGKVKTCSFLVSQPETSPAFQQNSQIQAYYKGQLSPPQLALADQLKSFGRQEREQAILLWAVTGAGKTEMMFSLVEDYLRSGARVALVAPRIDVVMELAPRLRQAFPQVDQCVLHSMSEDTYHRAPLTLATTHQMLRFQAAFDLILVDEVDSYPYEGSHMLHMGVDRALKPLGKLVYMTATPPSHYKQLVDQGQMAQLLLPARYHRHPLPLPRMIWQGEWAKLLKRRQFSRPILTWMGQHLDQSIPFLLFVPVIDQIPLLEDMCRRAFPQARFSSVSSKEPKRKERIEGMRRGEWDFLLTTTILERGVTFEGIDVAVLASQEEIFTRQVLVQIAGRVGRSFLHPDGQVVFFHSGKSKAMVQAIEEIAYLNQKAQDLGLLGDPH